MSPTKSPWPLTTANGNAEVCPELLCRDRPFERLATYALAEDDLPLEVVAPADVDRTGILQLSRDKTPADTMPGLSRKSRVQFENDSKSTEDENSLVKVRVPCVCPTPGLRLFLLNRLIETSLVSLLSAPGRCRPGSVSGRARSGSKTVRVACNVGRK